MSQLFVLPFQTPFHNSAPLGLAKAYFYRAGTTTHQAVYPTAADADAGTNAHDQPVQASAAGVFAPIFFDTDASYDYRLQLKTSADVLVDGGDIDNIPRRYTGVVLSTQVKYDQTDAETAAGVTPVNSQYPENWVPRYMSTSQLADWLAGTALVDQSTAFATAHSVNKNLYAPPGYYLLTESVGATDASGFNWTGVPYKTVLVNNASANKPTLLFTDCQYGKVRGFALAGRAGKPNTAILCTTAGGQTTCFNEFSNILLQPNGNGIELVKVNTNRFKEIEYWPSSGPSLGSTVDTGGSSVRKHAIFVDRTISNNYANEIKVEDSNLIGVDSTISGHAMIKAGSPIAGIQNWILDNCELESNYTALLINDAYNFAVNECFLENSSMTFTDCRDSEINGYSADDVTLAGTCIKVMLRKTAVNGTFTVGSSCVNCGGYDASFQTIADSSTTSTYINCTLAGVIIPLKYNGVSAGIWAGRTFSAGDYTGITGTWTVASGDVTSFRWKVDLNAKTMTVNVNLTSTTTAGGCTALNIAIPGGYTGAAFDQNEFLYAYTVDGGTNTLIGIARVQSGGSVINFYRDLAGTAFANVTDLLGLKASITFELS